MNMQLQFEITNFYSREAYLLDNRQYEEWLDLLADDLVYRMPQRRTGEGRDGQEFVHDMAFFEESKTSLTTRVKRLRTNSAWVEKPAPRTRHLITNILIEPESTENELHVRSAFLFLRSRGSDRETENLFGERKDILRKVGNEWKIASRIIYPDQAVMQTMNLSMFL